MIKVLHLIWNAKFGGIEKLTLDLCICQKNGDKVSPELLVGQKLGVLLEKFEESHIPIHSLDFKKGFDLDRKKYAFAVQLFKQYDVVHVHIFNPIIANALKKSGTKVVYTVHGGFGFGRKKRMNDVILSHFKSSFLRKHCNVITFNSNFTKNYADKELKIAHLNNSVVVYNGIAKNEISKLAHKDESLKKLTETLKSKFVVGTSSRLAGFKRIDRLIAAFAELKPETDYILLIVGDGVLKDDLVKKVKDSGLENRVIFAGYQPNVTDYQNLMDVCVFPSQNEPFGLVAVETLALGKPTLVFKDGGGITEIVGQYKKEDIVDTAEALNERIIHYKMNDNKEENTKRKIVAESFTIEKMSAKFDEIYESIVEYSANIKKVK